MVLNELLEEHVELMESARIGGYGLWEWPGDDGGVGDVQELEAYEVA